MSDGTNWQIQRMRDLWKMKGNTMTEDQPRPSARDIFKRAVSHFKAVEQVKRNNLLADKDGAWYFVERADPYSHLALVINEKGERLRINTIDTTPVLVEQSSEIGVGKQVKVTAIDPTYNQYRAFPTEPMQAPGIVGQIGEILFPYYPVDGVTMYRVLLPNGAHKDFTGAELQSDFTESEQLVARRRRIYEANGNGNNTSADSDTQPLPQDKSKNPAPGERVTLLDKKGKGKRGVVTACESESCVVMMDDGTERRASLEEIVAMSSIPPLGITGPSRSDQIEFVNDGDPVEGDRIEIEGRRGVVVGFPQLGEQRSVSRPVTARPMAKPMTKPSTPPSATPARTPSMAGVKK
jgi:hypothetical protein